MNLPNAENAIVPPEKLTDYLLSKSHLVGRWKASFFRSLGFSETNVNELKDALIDVAKRGEVKSTTTSVFGIKYEVEGTILAPNGKVAVIVTVWVIETKEVLPRLVTAYPA
ncbi:MAG: hypothetical protein R6V46_04070 [Desulfatiglandaceae bacterium]